MCNQIKGNQIKISAGEKLVIYSVDDKDYIRTSAKDGVTAPSSFAFTDAPGTPLAGYYLNTTTEVDTDLFIFTSTKMIVDDLGNYYNEFWGESFEVERDSEGNISKVIGSHPSKPKTFKP